MKKVTALFLGIIMTLSLAACGFSFDLPTWDFSDEPTRNSSQTKVPAEEEVVNTPTQIDLNSLPSLLEPIPGYHPYIVRLYNTENKLLMDLVPYICISDGSAAHRYTLQEAERKGIITGFRAYTADGYECDTSYVLTWAAPEEKSIRVAHSSVYAFYVPNGVKAEIEWVSVSDFLAFGSLDNIHVHWGHYALETYGFGYTYPVCTIPAEDGEAGYPENSVTYLDIYLEFFKGKQSDGSVHNFSMATKVDEHTVASGDFIDEGIDSTNY